MSGLHDAFDEIVADVPVYGDLDRALQQAEQQQRRRFGVIGGLAAAAAVAAIIGVLSINGEATRTEDPVGTPTPTEVIPAPSDGSIYFAAESSAGDALTDARSHFEVETDPKQMDIYLSRQGEPVRRIVATAAHERCPAVSPDGSRLAYLAGATVVIAPLDAAGDVGAAQVRVDLKDRNLDVQPAGYAPRNSPGPPCPQWSPDGRRLGYLAEVRGNGFVESLYDPVATEVHVVSLDGEDSVLVAFDTMAWDTPAFTWSPQGDEIAYTTLDGVWRAPLDGGSPELLWRTQEIDLTQKNPVDGDRPLSVTWSSQDEIAFTVRGFRPTEANNPMSGGNDTFTLVVVDADSRELFRKDAGSTLESGAAETWSPDGSLLVFTGSDQRIHLYDRASGATTRLSLAFKGAESVFAPSWSPDGQQLLARVRSQDRGIALASFDLDGSSGHVRTPWTWALDWTSLDDVNWSGR